VTTHRPGPITSAANPRIRAALDLRDRRGRERAGRLLVDGAREVERALDGGVEIVEAFVPADGSGDGKPAATIARLAATGAAIVPVAGPALARLAYGERGSEIVAVAVVPDTSLARARAAVAAVTSPFVVVVEDPEKPGNLGAIARSADGAGATALVAATGRGPAADPWNPNAIRASLGTVFTLPLAVAPTCEVLSWLREVGLRIVAARVQAGAIYVEVDLRGGVAIALGSEADGLGPEWLAADITGVRLPMLGRADSLNVSAAAAVLLYEARRQRDQAEGAGADERMTPGGNP
jgi:RNA methyltransferase, TrmH family